MIWMCVVCIMHATSNSSRCIYSTVNNHALLHLNNRTMWAFRWTLRIITSEFVNYFSLFLQSSTHSRLHIVFTYAFIEYRISSSMLWRCNRLLLWRVDATNLIIHLIGILSRRLEHYSLINMQSFPFIFGRLSTTSRTRSCMNARYICIAHTHRDTINI